MQEKGGKEARARRRASGFTGNREFRDTPLNNWNPNRGVAARILNLWILEQADLDAARDSSTIRISEQLSSASDPSPSCDQLLSISRELRE